jgi:hypothetical protein
MNKFISLFTLAIIITSTSCEEGDDGKKSMVNLIDEPPGINCLAGGNKMDVGLDLNDNAILENNEIQITKYICNGAVGLKSLLRVESEGPGVNCPSGGNKLFSGIDLNANNILDDSEIQDLSFICNGETPKTYKELRISFPGQGYQYSSTDIAGNTNQWTFIYDFNIDNYDGADSVVFASLLRSSASSSSGIAELYDITHDAPISNSQISTTEAGWTWTKSPGNLLQYIPSGPITLAIRIRPEVQGVEAAYFMPVLIIYKK